MESIPEALLLRRFTSMLHIIFLHGGMPLLDEPGTHRGWDRFANGARNVVKSVNKVSPFASCQEEPGIWVIASQPLVDLVDFMIHINIILPLVSHRVS